MPILSKGYSFGSTEQVTSTKLGNLVDAAAFTTGAVDGTTTELSGGAIVVKNAGITPSKLSTGKPTWDSAGNVSISGTLTTGGTISTSNDLAVNGDAIAGSLTVTGDTTLAGQIIRSGTTSGRTVQMRTGSTTPNVISFGWNSGDLLVTIDGVEFKVTLTAV